MSEAATIDVTGFPLDFNMTATDIALADPGTGWAWQAPELRADSQATVPTRINVTWPEEHAVATNATTITPTDNRPASRIGKQSLIPMEISVVDPSALVRNRTGIWMQVDQSLPGSV